MSYPTQDFWAVPMGTYTTNQLSAPIQNQTFKGIIVFLHVQAASGTGGIKVFVQSINPLDNTTGTIFLATANVTAASGQNYVYTIYPGITVGGTQGYNSVLSSNFAVGTIVADGSSYTYSVAYELLP